MLHMLHMHNTTMYIYIYTLIQEDCLVAFMRHWAKDQPAAAS